MELVSRSERQSETASYQPVSPMKRRKQHSAPPPIAVALTPNEQTCVNYGFKRGTTSLAQCVMQLDQAKQQAELAQQQYRLQLQQYQQQQVAYEAQQEAMKRERSRRQGQVLLQMSQGMLNSRSGSFLGGLNDGFAAVGSNGATLAPPAPPQAPISQNYTVRLPNGTQIFCNYNTAASYMNCN
jgi:hypothetical protein